MSAAAAAQISVEILDLPTEAYSFEPVYVLYSVENTGQNPLYLPAGGAPRLGPNLFLASGGESPGPNPFVPTGDPIYSHSVAAMWLAPGENWLFYESVDHRMSDGELSVQAVMASDGRCGEKQVYGRHSFSLESAFLETATTGVISTKVFSCWKGEVRSGVRGVTIRPPSDPVDRRAFKRMVEMEYLTRRRATEPWRLSGLAYKIVAEYPSSHYSYAVLAQQSSVMAKLQATTQQPDNPLNRWLNGVIAQEILRQNSSCWQWQPLELELNLAESDLPTGFEHYLEQYAWYLENRLCSDSKP